MAKATTTSRWTRNSRQDVGTPSPFASYTPSDRQAGAERMIVKRQAELERLQASADIETRPRFQRILAQRILATKNNIDSWVDYLAEEHPFESRAVIVTTN